MTDPETSLPPPTPAFASLARRLLRQKEHIVETERCQPDVALQKARNGLVWEYWLDAGVKTFFLGGGTVGILALSAPGAIVSTATTLAAAWLIMATARPPLRQAALINEAHDLCRSMTAENFQKHLNSAPKEPRPRL